MNHIFTYYEPVKEIRSQSETDLIKLWQDRWQAQGWATHVINEDSARNHPSYRAYRTAVEALPTVNPGLYDYHCWMRWLAMASQDVEMAVMSDYDVMPYGFEPLRVIENDVLTFYQRHVPALVSGHPDGFLRQCQRFAAYRPKICDTVNGRPHVSDMYATMWLMDSTPIEFISLDMVKLYTETGWETAPAVHYSNGTMQPNGKMPRHQHIPNLRH